VALAWTNDTNIAVQRQECFCRELSALSSSFGAQPGTSAPQVAMKRNWREVWELWSIGRPKLAQQASHSITPTLLYSTSNGVRIYSGLLQHAVVHVLANGAIASAQDDMGLTDRWLQLQDT
jgi:hypothetical protein